MLSELALLSLLPSLLAWQTSAVTPSGNYTPTIGPCPDSSWVYVRPATEGLSAQEKDWLPKRQAKVVAGFKDYLNMVDIKGFDAGSYISTLQGNASDIPVIGVAVSGGGTRAEMCAFGLYQAMDGRNNASVQAGTGGLLQTVTYWTGLSGGSETTVGLALNSFPTFESLLANHQLNQTTNFALFEELGGKAELGFNLNVGDLFGIAALSHLATVPSAPNVDPLSWTWSGLQVQDAFSSGSTPMPLVMLVDVAPPGVPGSVQFETPNGTVYLADPTGDTVFEINPFEFGSWNGRIKAFSDLQFWGTTMSGGYPASSEECVTGYDSAVYVGGSALSAINFWFAEVFSNGTVGQFAKRDSIEKRQNQRGPNPPFIPYPEGEAELEELLIAGQVTDSVYAIPDYLNLTGSTLEEFLYAGTPNPFYGYSNGVDDSASNQKTLLLVDGSETGQEIPLWPLLQPERRADFLIASDNGGTELLDGWANGTNFRNTYLAAKRAGLAFPELPSVNTMLNYGYTTQPTFFGCNEPDVPLVLYVADFPYAAYGNISDFGAISENQSRIIASNGLPLLSQDGGNLAPNFPQCIACGAIWRSLERMGWDKPDVCKQCMQDYCWQGQVNDASPSYLQPALVLQPNLTWAEWNSTVFFG